MPCRDRYQCNLVIWFHWEGYSWVATSLRVSCRQHWASWKCWKSWIFLPIGEQYWHWLTHIWSFTCYTNYALSYNLRLSSTIPLEYGNMISLTKLSLQSNYKDHDGYFTWGIKGKLPTELGNLKNLQHMDISTHAPSHCELLSIVALRVKFTTT